MNALLPGMNALLSGMNALLPEMNGILRSACPTIRVPLNFGEIDDKTL